MEINGDTISYVNGFIDHYATAFCINDKEEFVSWFWCNNYKGIANYNKTKSTSYLINLIKWRMIDFLSYAKNNYNLDKFEQIPDAN